MRRGWPVVGGAVGALLVAAACGRLEVDPSLDVGAATDADTQEDAFDAAGRDDAATEDAVTPTSCPDRGSLSPFRALASRTPSLAVGAGIAAYGPAEVDVGGCGPSAQGTSPIRLEPAYAFTCTTAQWWTGSGAAFVGDDLLVAGFSGGATGESFGMLRVRWPAPEAGIVAEKALFSVRLPSGASVHTRAVAREGARLHVSGSTLPELRAIVASLDVARANPGAGDLRLTAYEEPRLVSFDDLAGRGDGTFWASGRTADGGLALVRFGKDETPDATFGEQGLFAVPGASDVRATKVLALADGGALLGAVNGAGEATVRRVTAAGALDASYGQGGVVRAPFPAGGPVLEGRAQLALERSGAARFAGADPTETGKDPRGYMLRAAKVARVLPSGSLDVSFGDAGIARVVASAGGPEQVDELRVQLEGSDDLDACAGKLVVGLVASSPGAREYGGFLGSLVP